MRPPFIVCMDRDVEVFATTEDAEQSMEVIDVENGEYVVFDSQGRRLAVVVEVTSRPMLWGLLTQPVENVVIKDVAGAGADPAECLKLMRDFLVNTGSTDAEVSNLGVAELINLISARTKRR